MTLDKIIADTFSISHAEARRLISQGGVRRENGRQVSPGDTVAEGEQLRAGRRAARKAITNKEAK